MSPKVINVSIPLKMILPIEKRHYDVYEVYEMAITCRGSRWSHIHSDANLASQLTSVNFCLENIFILSRLPFN